MTQSNRQKLNDYESLLSSNVPFQHQSNLIVNPINELVNAIPNFTNRNAQLPPTNYYQTSIGYQTGYCQSNQQSNIQSSNIQSNLIQTIQSNHNNQQHSNDLQQPVSTSSSASTALLQSTPFQTSLTKNGLNTQLILPPKLSTNKLKSNSINIWPINRNKSHFNQPTNPMLNLTNCSNNRTQLISKINKSSFTYHLLTCALIAGIVTLILIVISSLYIYSSCKCES